MGSARSTLISGAAHLSIAGTAIHIADDGDFEINPSFKDIISAVYGPVDEVNDDLLIKISATPLTFVSASSPALILPYLSGLPGALYPSSTDTPAVLYGNNGDVYTAVNTVITKMPDMTFGADVPLLGKMELTGIIGDSMDPETASSYYTVATGTYTPLALTKTQIPRGKYTWVWGTATGWGTATPIEFLKPPTLTWDLKIDPVKVQGRTRAFRLQSLRAMFKGIPVGPTAANILAAAKLSADAAATHGHRASANAATLTGTGPIGVAIANAALKTAGFKFSNSADVLRAGEVGFVTTVNTSSVPPAAIVAFS